MRQSEPLEASTLIVVRLNALTRPSQLLPRTIPYRPKPCRGSQLAAASWARGKVPGGSSDHAYCKRVPGVMVDRAFRQWTAATFSLKRRSPENVNKNRRFIRVIPCWFAGIAGGVAVGRAMQQADWPPKCLRFAVFEADLRTGELTKRGKRVRLQEQPFRLLAMLLENREKLVTREELRGRLWPKTIVDFDHGLNKAISKIRDALGDSAENPRFIETVAGRGYRFLADVVVVHDERPEAVLAILPRMGTPVPLQRIDAGTSPRRPHRMPLPGGFPASGWPWCWRRLIVGFLSVGAHFTTIRSLAVLPLENLSGDASQEYFADGMTDELITDLGQISAMRVISRTSAMTYKSARKPLPEIARELNVQAVVEGSVLRSGERRSDHRPIDRGARRQAYLGPKLRRRFPRHAGAPEQGGPRHRRANPGHLGSAGTGGAGEVEDGEPGGL